MTIPFARHVSDLGRDVFDEIVWLVFPLLPKGILALLAAYMKVGKSTFAYQLAVAVAQGRPFLDRETLQGGVLIISAEERVQDVLRRLRRCGMHEDDPLWVKTELTLDTPDTCMQLEQFIRDHHVILVIIDTLASFMLIQDENNNSLVTMRLKPYVDLAHRADVTVLFLHHERKNGDGESDPRRIRGGSAIFGLADLAWQLQKQPGSETKRQLQLTGRYDEIPRKLDLDYQGGALRLSWDSRGAQA